MVSQAGNRGVTHNWLSPPQSWLSGAQTSPSQVKGPPRGLSLPGNTRHHLKRPQSPGFFHLHSGRFHQSLHLIATCRTNRAVISLLPMRKLGPEGHSHTLSRWPLAQLGIKARPLWLPNQERKRGQRSAGASPGFQPWLSAASCKLTVINQMDLFSFGGGAPQGKSTLAELGASLLVQMTSMAEL